MNLAKLGIFLNLSQIQLTNPIAKHKTSTIPIFRQRFHVIHSTVSHQIRRSIDMGSMHRPNTYKDIKPEMSSLLVFNRVFGQIPNLQNCFTTPNKNLGGKGASDR
jgi:hypothetical protein